MLEGSAVAGKIQSHGRVLEQPYAALRLSPPPWERILG